MKALRTKIVDTICEDPNGISALRSFIFSDKESGDIVLSTGKNIGSFQTIPKSSRSIAINQNQ